MQPTSPYWFSIDFDYSTFYRVGHRLLHGRCKILQAYRSILKHFCADLEQWRNKDSTFFFITYFSNIFSGKQKEPRPTYTELKQLDYSVMQGEQSKQCWCALCPKVLYGFWFYWPNSSGRGMIGFSKETRIQQPL